MIESREINDILLKVNKICYGDKFRRAFLDKFKYLPSGLTYHCSPDDEYNLHWFLVPKEYGYEHSCNNGLTEGTDAFDFNIGRGDITDEMRDWVEDYFIHYETEFYNTYML